MCFLLKIGTGFSDEDLKNFTASLKEIKCSGPKVGSLSRPYHFIVLIW